MSFKSIGEMFFAKRNESPDNTAYMYKESGEWKSVSFREVTDKVEKLAAGLAASGIKKGDKVAIVSANCLEWAMVDYATVSLGAILVTIYPSLLKEQVQYILNDSESKAVFAQDDIQAEKVDEIRKKVKTLESFIIIDEKNSDIKDPWKGFNSIIDDGTEFLQKDDKYVSNAVAGITRNDWLTLIYTSGTTGEPKGAILTHGNLLSNIEAGLKRLTVGPTDTFLSFLPLSHVFERMAGHYLAYYSGAKIAYAESIDTVPINMGEIKPTVMASVPRLYEKMYARVLESVELGSGLKQKIFHWAVGVGREYINKIMYKKPVGATLQYKRNIAYKLVFSKLAERVGGKIRFMISGGAPLSGEIAEFFGAAGIMILEGYGLTETSPLISVNTLDDFRYGTVGQPAPGVDVRIEEDGEISAKGPNIMVGYYKKEADTKEVLDDDGWFHTGDIGHLDEDGFLKITDRKKNILVTAGGKNIAPQPIENIMITSKYIEQFMMIGDRRKFCSAVIVASEDPLKKWADAKGLNYSGFSELVKLPGVQELVRAEIDRLSAGLASYETIKKFFMAPAPFTIESDELTPSLKVKRKVVLEKYAKEIDALYNNGGND
ncbi:MAG: long-chain fatty acid--CoA ligase [Calditrichae bacterium]|nr:long-chain fatty acid--CoA ligase [Calditrichia bacterium]